MVNDTDTERENKLRSIPLFSELSEPALEHILGCVTEHEVPGGQVLVQPNQPGAGLFIVADGTVVVERKDGNIELGKGEFFGELALLDENAVHSARVRAAGPARVLALARNDFTELIESEPHITLSMLKILARRLRQATSHRQTEGEAKHVSGA